MFTKEEFAMAHRAVRARYHHSARTRRDWVLYVDGVDILRDIEKGQASA